MLVKQLEGNQGFFFLTHATIHETMWPSCMEMGRQASKQLLLYSNLGYGSQALILQCSKIQKGYRSEMQPF
jgi:hypothetical protein